MKISVKKLAFFAMVGALMLASKFALEFLPNIHLLGVFVTVLTIVFRVEALIPLYVFVLLEGLLNGFSVWWIPYLYLFTVLFAAVLLVPLKWPNKVRYPLYTILCGLNGFLFGTLYAPCQALFFHLSFEGMCAWIVAGLPFDAIHGVSNLILGSLLIYPLSKVLEKAKRFL